MQFPIVIYQDEDGVWIGEVPILKGVGSFGSTQAELLVNLEDAINLYLEDSKEILPPSSTYTFRTLNINAKTKNRISQKTPQLA